MAQDLVADAFIAFNGSVSRNIVSARTYFNEAYYAEYNDQMVGVIMAAFWGSIRCLGPLGVSPKYQKNGIFGIMMRYMDQSPAIINNRNIKREVLQTFCASYHVPMYIKYGYQPRFIQYKARMKTDEIDIILKYVRKLSGINRYKIFHQKSYDKTFLNECENLTNSVYKGLNYNVYIEGRWKYKDFGGSYGMYDVNNQLNGFAVLNYGKNSKTSDYETNMKICCLVAIDADTFKSLVFNVLKIAKNMGKDTVTTYVYTARMRTFNIMTDFFDFKYNPKDPMISMGKCRGDDEQYDDHNNPNVFVIDTM
eukprot:129166_1